LLSLEFAFPPTVFVFPIALLALEHEGAASPRRAGFPRLVGPSGSDCFLSVKSVDRIEVTRQPQRATAATIALARLER